jgi:protoporphyrinogen oxidase
MSTTIRTTDGAASGEFAPPIKYESDRRKHVVICGAGPAGLTAAYLLVKQGCDVTVLESDEVVGGISRTARYKHYRFDIGGHRFFTKIKPVQQMWEELLGDEFIEVPRLSRILYDGKFFNYPLKAANALMGLGLWNTVLIISSYAKARIRPHPVEENFEQWVSNRFGSRLYRIFFKTYTEKVWGIPCTEIRAEWAAQRVQGLSLVRAIISATSLQRRNITIKSLIERFKYPRLGPGQMWETCASKVAEMGGRVLMSHRVRSFELENGSARAALVETSRGVERIEGDHFITTVPLRSLVRALDPAPPPAVTEAAERLAYRDFILVALILDRDELFPDNWIYVHTAGVQVGRIQNFNNWSSAMVPQEGVTCIGMEYFCFSGDGLWNMSDTDLLALASEELSKLGLARGAKVIDGSVVRMPKAYPIYDSTYGESVRTIREHLDTIPNLTTVGRNGMHKYNNQDHSMYTAMLAVENLNGAAHDLWSVNTDFEYHEEQRIEEEAQPASGAAHE